MAHELGTDVSPEIAAFPDLQELHRASLRRVPWEIHGGGINAVFADGHVQFLTESITLTTFAALCTRAAGETIERIDP